MNGDAILDDCRDKGAPWERHYSCGETARAYGVFGIFRDLEAGRSLRATAEQAGVPVSRVASWSQRWAWTPRVEAWDAAQDEQRSRRFAAKRRTRNENLEQLADSTLLRYGQWLEALDRERAGAMTPGEARGLFETAAKIARLVQGDATEKIEADIPERLKRLLARVTIPTDGSQQPEYAEPAEAVPIPGDADVGEDAD